MAQMAVPYQTDQLPEQNAPRPVIPAGDYMGVVTESEVKPTKDNTGQYIQLLVVIVEDEQFNGHEIVERINFNNPNEQAVTIANGTIRGFNEAAGIAVMTDTVQWHNIPMIVTVGVEEASGNFAEKNSIKLVMPSGRTVIAPVAPVAVVPTANPQVAPPVAVAPVAVAPPAAVAPVAVAPPVAAPPVAVAPVATPVAPAPVAVAPVAAVPVPVAPAPPVAQPAVAAVAPVAVAPPVAPVAPAPPVAGTVPAF